MSFERVAMAAATGLWLLLSRTLLLGSELSHSCKGFGNLRIIQRSTTFLKQSIKAIVVAVGEEAVISIIVLGLDVVILIVSIAIIVRLIIFSLIIRKESMLSESAMTDLPLGRFRSAVLTTSTTTSKIVASKHRLATDLRKLDPQCMGDLLEVVLVPN